MTSPAPTETRQQALLQQLLDHQLALKQLLDQQPEAEKTLNDRLHQRIQQAFPSHPLPIALSAVSYRTDIQFASRPGTYALAASTRPERPLSSLLTDKPWGGEDLDAPNRIYRFYAKGTYQRPHTNGVRKMATVTSTVASTPAFESFVDELLRRPDRLFVQQLEQFWQAPFASGATTTRRQWLADQKAKALQAEAALRVEDGTLEPASENLIDLIVRYPIGADRAHLPQHQRPGAYAVALVGQDGEPDTPLTGLLIFSTQTPDADAQITRAMGAALLCCPDRGIEAFASLQALDEALKKRLTSSAGGDQLIGTMPWQAQTPARRRRKTSFDLRYTAIATNPFENRVDALLALQEQDIEYAWRLLPRHEADGKRIYEVFNRLAHLGPFLDIRGVLVTRSRLYLEATLPSWYGSASESDRQSLQQLAATELSTSKQLAALLKKTDIAPLKTFARSELIRQLAVDFRARKLDPDNIQVKITTRHNPASGGGGIGPDHVPLPGGKSEALQRTLTLSLTELALRNSNPWEFGFYKLYTGEHTVLSASGTTPSGKSLELDHRYLTGLIQFLDVGKRYDELLKTRLIDNGAALRAAWSTARRASLETSALAARLNKGCFLDDREHRGYQWVKAIIDGDTPTTRPTVGGHKIVANSLLIANSAGTRNGHIVNDILVIRAANSRSVPNVILYTPAVPGEEEIREFADFAAMHEFLQQQWATSSQWRRYFMQRLSIPGQVALTESRLTRTHLLSQLVLSSTSRVGNPFDVVHLVQINTSLAQKLYEQQIVTLRRNADHMSTTNAEVDAQSLWNAINFGIDLALNLMGLLPITSALNVSNNVIRTFLLLKQTGVSKTAARALWSITGARGRPMTLKKLGALPAFRTSPDLSDIEATVDPSSLHRLEANLLQSKTSSQQYALINGRHYLSDVAQGQRFIYPPGAARKSLRYPLILDDTLKHWRVEPLPRLPGGMDEIEKGPLHTTFRDYELPRSDVAALPALNSKGPGSLNLGSVNLALPMDPGSVGALHVFGIQSRLRRHARGFFRTFSSSQRPVIVPQRGLSPEQLLQQLYIQRDGVIFGEKHIYSLARQFMVKNVNALKKVGVKTAYFELFNTDLHQVLLDQYNVSPQVQLPQVLKERLQIIDHMALQSDEFSYTRLIDDIHAQGIRVMALDTTASSLYASDDLTVSAPTLADQLDRVTMFNFFAYKRVNAELSARGPHRWVALVGQGHCNTLQNIPGLAELTNATGLRLERRIGNVPRLSRDPGVMIHSPLGTDQFLHSCDLLVGLPSAENRIDLHMRVHSPNLFTTTSSRQHHASVYYMNDRRQYMDVKVFVDGTEAYVDHAPFGAVSGRRFRDLDHLTEALIDELGMIEV